MVKHLAWLLPVTVLGVGAALVRIGLLDLPWPLTPEPTTVPTATEPAGPETGPLAGGSPPQVVSDVAVYSVSLGSYQAADFAATRVAALRATVPGVLFTSVPVDVDGYVIHRILAGAVADSASAAALAETVGESLGAPSFEWGLRPTPFAFLVDEHETRADAERTAQELSDLSIPAYVLALDLSDGSTRFRVYVGAFEDAREASHLSTRLESLNVQPAQFTHRAGRAPS